MMNSFLRLAANQLMSNDHHIKKVFLNSMLFRYSIGIFAMIFLYAFRHRLPFPFPGFFFVSAGFVLANCLLHLASLKKEWLRQSFLLLPYFDCGFAPFVFLASGGFLSPFVISHIVTALGSGILHTTNKKLPLHSLTILLSSYLGVAFLHKFGIIPCSIGYVQTMLSNDFFFYFVISITSAIFGIGFVVVKMLNGHVHQTLDDLTHSFDSIIKGTIGTVDQDFFVQLIKHLSESLSMRCVMVAELKNKNALVRTLAVWKEGKNDENFESPVSGTVFSEVLSHNKFVIDHDASRFYQSNPLLAQCKAAFFFGLLLKDSKEKPIGVLCMVNDKLLAKMYLVEPLMTIFASRAAAELERKIAEEKQKLIEMQLAHAHKMEAIGNLVGGIAHDFNNMVSAIGGCAQLLKSKLDADSPNQRYVTHIINAGAHTVELINHLTGFARRERPRISSVDVHKVIADTLALMEGTTKKNINLVKNLLAPEWMVPSDDASLQNALLNIAINGRDAMETNGGTLTFETALTALDKSSPLCQSFQIPPGDYISVSISDTGIGMNDEVMRHLFEPFFTTKPKGKGTGLGLANVWGFIENYKCAVDVKSKPALGSTFTLYLPLLQKPVPRDSSPSSLTHREPKANDIKTILIVDDETAQREISREMLENKGFSLIFRENGLEAVNCIKDIKNGVDLVILDLMMPIMNGHDAFYEIRKIDPQVKIIIASGYINKKDLKGIATEPKTAFIQKPFSGEMLLRTIHDLSVEGVR
jgi:signal transduction histidine kinase